MLSNRIDKDLVATEMAPLRALFTKSLVAAEKLSAGHFLTEEDLLLKKPGSGLPASAISRVVGRKLLRDLQPDELLREGDVE